MLKIISGGQTGVDRGALEAALEVGVDFGGWAPQRFIAEDGVIPAVFRIKMKQTSTADYRKRTRQNIISSDGTLIFVDAQRADVGPGTALTLDLCNKLQKPHLRVPMDVRRTPDASLAEMIRAWCEDEVVMVLNVAGPRETHSPGAQRWVKEQMILVLKPVVVIPV